MKRNFFKILVATFALSALTFQARAETIRLHNYLLQDRLTKNGESPYNLVLKEIFDHTGVKADQQYAPMRRNSVTFLRDDGSCVYPAAIGPLTRYDEYKDKQPSLITSEALDYVGIYVYTQKNQPKIKSRQELNGLRIGYIVGSVANTLIGSMDASFWEVDTDKQLVKMLDAGRLDAILGFHPDLPMAIDRLGHEGLQYNPDLALFRASTKIICFDTPKNREFLDKANEILIELKQNGKMQEMLGPHAEITEIGAK